MNQKKSIQDIVAEERIEFIDLQFVDVTGAVKSVTIPASRIQHVEGHRQWFDGSAVESFARVSESDMYLKPDPSTFAVLPWLREGERTARVICDVHAPNGEPFGGDPRFILKSVLRDAEEAGLTYEVGPEVEFFLFRTPIGATLQAHDSASYFDLSTDLGYQVRKEMVRELQGMNIEVETIHHEVAPGQHEIDIAHGGALPTADAVTTLKWVVSEVAQRHELHASFMPKPIFGVAGSGMHVHQSLGDAPASKNLFCDASGQYGLSDLARHFIAGQLAHARGMSAILAPLVNSYKRLVAGYEAPVHLSWARVNRSALIRVPETAPDTPETTRVELRMPDPSCNPYLAFAVMLGAGLDGIARELPLPEPVEESLYAFGPQRSGKFNVRLLPTNLHEALDELAADEVICDLLGPVLLERFLEAKRMEWEDYRVQVTPWEIDRYLRSH